MRPVTRAPARLPTAAMQTYQVASPIETHTRPGTCHETDCAAYRNGFRLTVDESTDLGRRQAAYVRSSCVPETVRASEAARSARRYTEGRNEAGLTTFTFPAGTPCFAEHRVSLERPELFIVRGGDHRGNPMRSRRQHTRPEDWVEDFAEHQDRIATTIEQG